MQQILSCTHLSNSITEIAKYTIWLPRAVCGSTVEALATSWKVANSIPDGVFEIFHLPNSSGLTMALGLAKPLTEMSTRVKVASA